MRIQNERWARPLREVEVARERAEDRFVLADVGARIRAAVGARVDALATEEVVLDELDVGVEAERLMVDEALASVGADHEAGDAKPVAVAVDARRRHVVVEAAPVVPREEDRRRLPLRPA